MTVLKVITYGNNILRTPSKEVHKISAKIQKLIDDMFDTMYANNGVGLAAPQVGYNYRIFVLDDSGEKDTLAFNLLLSDIGFIFIAPDIVFFISFKS